GEHGRRCIDRNREESHSPDADERRPLREPERRDQRVAEGIPGKAAEEVPAQPLRQRERDGERQQTLRAARPNQTGEREAEAGIDPKPGRHADDRKRQQPAEDLGIDQERIAHQIEAGEKIAEPEPPPGRGGREYPAETAGGSAVDEPDQDRKGEERDRPEVKWRQRQRRRRAGKQRNQIAPPSPGQDDDMGEAGEPHRRVEEFDSGAPEESLNPSVPALPPSSRARGAAYCS